MTRQPPTPAGLAAITPFRMSDEERDAIIEQCRAGERQARRDGQVNAKAWRMTASRVAARLMQLTECGPDRAVEIVKSVTRLSGSGRRKLTVKNMLRAQRRMKSRLTRSGR